MLRTIVLWSVLGILCSQLSYSQTPSAAEKVDLILEFTSDFPTYDPAVSDSFDISSDSILLKAIVTLPDGQTNTEVHIKAGTTSGGTDLVNTTFVLGSAAPAGMAYTESGDKLYLTLGNFYGINAIHAEVILEDASTNQSAATTASLP